MSDNPQDPESDKEDQPTIEERTIESGDTSASKSSKRKADDDESREQEGAQNFKRQRKEPLPDTAVFDWELPSEMAQYARKYFERYVQEKDMKDSVISENQTRNRNNFFDMT